VRAIIRLLAALALLVAPAAAEVAETYNVEAGRLTGLGSNVAIDITAHGTDSVGVWLATGRGISYSFDDGESWYVYNRQHGLPAENLSAIFSVGGRIWVASNHNEFIQDQLMTLSNGLTYSDDDGETWTTIDFGSTGLNIPYVIGGDRTIFDITGHTDSLFFNDRPPDSSTAHWLFAAAFAGGLLASQDGGIHWRRIFASRMDSIQYSYPNEAPSLRNRYFSCVADTSHGDSLFLWTGTAAGIFQYVFAPPRSKLYSRWINCVAFCDTCSSGDGSRLFIGGKSGVSLGSAAGGGFESRFEIDGLPGREVSALVSIGDNVIVGTIDPTADTSTGLAISIDQGDTFAAVSGAGTGADAIVPDFAVVDGRVYAAARQAGLFVSTDSGLTWSDVPLDAWYSDLTLLTANAVAVFDDTLLVGTDSGLIALTMDAGGAIVDTAYQPFYDTDTTSARVVRIRIQWFENMTTPGTYDSAIVWTVHRPLDLSGVSMVARRAQSGVWTHFRRDITVYDVNFFSDTVFAVGENGIWFSPWGTEMTNFFWAQQYLNDNPDTTVTDNLNQDTVTMMEVRGDTVVFGCSNGLAISHNRGCTFRIYRPNTDTLSADFVVNHTYLTSLGGLAGDFVPSLAVQYRDAAPARVWVGARPAEMGGQGISAGEYDSTGIMKWHTVYENDFAWNFEFMGDSALAATSLGLLLSDGSLDALNTPWDTVALTDQTSGETLVAAGTSVYGLSVVGSYLWVGTDDGTVRISRSDLGDQQLYLRVDSTTPPDEVYAFPVPFRPSQEQTVDFHFAVEEAGNVTVEVYDFAMNLVATPINNLYYEAGVYPSQGHQGRTWDGRNGKGDLVAVGVYYFKVVLGSGETRWGKLAVIP
jgi:hypothetical protein